VNLSEPIGVSGPATRCSHCGEICEERHISLALPRSNSGLAVVRNVPAEVCRACGDTQFSIHTSVRIANMFKNDHKPESVAQVPIYNMEAVVKG
jgi:hypothetical protein